MTPEIQELIAKVQSHYAMPIAISVTGSSSGELTHDQTEQRLNKKNELIITVKDKTDVAYSLSHELLHMQLQAEGFPTLEFGLATGNPEYDQQFAIIATVLYNVVLHRLVASRQRENGWLTEETEQALRRGYERKLNGPTGNEFYRLVTMLDALATLGDSAKSWLEQDEEVEALDAMIQKANPQNPFSFRRTVVQFWRRFDAVIEKRGYSPTVSAEFATLTPVLSKRQLRLRFDQTFTLQHSDWLDRKTKKRAYIALGKGDSQNAFVLPLTLSTPEEFQAFYQRPLSSVLEEYKVGFTVREG